jgi:hypothetical protein
MILRSTTSRPVLSLSSLRTKTLWSENARGSGLAFVVRCPPRGSTTRRGMFRHHFGVTRPSSCAADVGFAKIDALVTNE